MITCIRVSKLILAVIIIFTLSCAKQTENVGASPTLTGTWKWVRTEGGFSYHIETPASTGKNVNISLNDDFRYFIYTNGVLSSQGTYSFVTQNCIHDNTNKRVINFSSPNEQAMMIEKMSNQNLELSDNAYDGMTSSYVKE